MSEPPRVLDNIHIGSDGRAQFPTDFRLWHIIGGEVVEGDTYMPILDPLGDGTEVMWLMPNGTSAIVEQSISAVSQYRSGTGLKWSIPERADVYRRAAALIRDKYWHKLAAIIRACFPKSKLEAENELTLFCRWLDSLSAHRIRLLTGYGDGGQGYDYCRTSHSMYIPHGITSGVWPLNYPIEIEGLQGSSSTACENVMLSKPHEYCGPASLAIQEIYEEAGMPRDFYSVVHGYGPDCEALITDSRVAQSVFTGSGPVAHYLSAKRPDLKVEDAGLNWIWFEDMWLGADVSASSTGTHSSYAKLSGQRCSCARYLFLPQAWVDAGLINAVASQAGELHWEDHSQPALMTWTTDDLLGRYEEMEQLGFQRLHGGERISAHRFRRPADAPAKRFLYGAVTPAIFQVTPDMLMEDPVGPLGQALRQERFAPNLVVVPIGSSAERQRCLDFIHSMPHRLTCGIGSPDPMAPMQLRHELPLNGVTNVGQSPWTTGAEEYKLFGPVAGNGATIGGSDIDVRSVWLSRIGIHTA